MATSSVDVAEKEEYVPIATSTRVNTLDESTEYSEQDRRKEKTLRIFYFYGLPLLGIGVLIVLLKQRKNKIDV